MSSNSSGSAASMEADHRVPPELITIVPPAARTDRVRLPPRRLSRRREASFVSKAAASPRSRAVAARPITAALAWAAVAVLAAACTAAAHQSPPPSVSPAQGPLSSAGRPENRVLELSCADANLSAQAPTGTSNHIIDGVAIDAAPDSLTGSAPADVGLRVPSGPPLFFAKAPLYLKTGTPTTTIKLSADSERYLAWVPSRIWTSGSGPIDLTPWMATAVVLDGCPGHPSTFLGGLLSTDRRMCLTLLVSQTGTRANSRTVRLGPSNQC